MFSVATRFTRMRALTISLLVSASLVTAQQAPTFSREQLDQMMAPIALYPDSLLSQVLMASTYPADVADAAKWSKANSKQQGRCRREGGAGQALGPERAVAGRLPAGDPDDGRPARLDAEPRRRLPGLVEGRARLGSAAADQGPAAGQPQDDRAAEGDRRAGTADAADRDQDRAHEPGGGLRAGLQPDRGLWRLALSGLSAVLLPALPGLLPGRRARHRHRLRRRRGRRGVRSGAMRTGAAAT